MSGCVLWVLRCNGISRFGTTSACPSISSYAGRICIGVFKRRIARYGYGGDCRCCLCAADEESPSHLFFECRYSSKCVQFVAAKMGINVPVSDTWNWWNQCRFPSLFHKKVIGAVLSAIIYRVWKARNHSLHNSMLIRPEIWMKSLLPELVFRCKSLVPPSICNRYMSWLNNL
ncbi:hypothetical protein RND81_06G056600 [Saponaria officinalis]|uniref:Reverse transcriptase zinc-binding domain-containing protein n=1 Tax=Saponaria officinalis TaxID=3572 RepID=A0AAW1K7H8_SAPOF